MFFPTPDLVPQFKPHLRADIIASDVLLIISERARLILPGQAIVQVAQMIDGIRNAGQIVEALRDKLAMTEVLTALEQIAAKGHLQAGTGDHAHPPAARAFWELMQADGGTALANLAVRSVAIECIGGLCAERLAQTLAASAIRVADGARLKIILTDDYLRPELAAISARAAQEGIALLLVKPVGILPTIGPLIHPQFGSCLACLQFWLRHNRPVETLISRLQDGAPCHLPLALGAAGEQAVYGMLASSIASLLALQEDRIPLRHTILALDLQTLESKRHTVVKRPQCRACGDDHLMQRQAEAAPQLQSVRDLYCKDGGYRQRDPLQTFEQYQHLISPVSGPIAYLHTMPRRHVGMRKVYVAGYLVCPQDIPRGNSFDKICAGKGQTDEQARASALCEALERYSGVYQGDEACVRASMRELGAAAIDFNALQNFSQGQYDQRDTINRQTDDKRRQVPQRFDQDCVIDWTTAWSLTTGQKHYVPLTYCYAEAPPASGAAYGIHNPNGAAAGNCLEEAILQGFLELVERDATAIWWYNQLPLPGIALASFGDLYFERLVRDYAAIGWDLRVLDLTHDLGITVCAAIAHHAGEDRYAIGFGCHLNAQLAVQRALTEVNQLFDPSGNSPAPWDQSQLTDTRFLFPAAGQNLRAAGEMMNGGGIDLKDDVMHCMRRLREHGMEMLVVNKTRPDIGLCVAQVIVPGLRHFWPRLGAGRLYSVPLGMGWLTQETSETALNPTPLFL